ncbi:MAG TPA: hypothetical protein VFO60_01200 [Candidatus Dormibacteraeota bacterium]|nr:hypothetical protein [Candidatus Dormibacteraeota bacterium]
MAILDGPLGTDGNALRLVRADGVEVAHADLASSVEAVALAGRRALIAGDGRILALDDRGSLTEVERLAPEDPTDLVRGVIADPTGSTWLWTVLHRDPGGDLHSRVYLGADGADPRLLLDHVDADHALSPLSWSPEGPLVAEDPVGIGGYILFRRAFGATDRVDVDRGVLVPVAPAACALSDLAADGTAACIADGREGPHGDGPVTLRLLAAGRAARSLAFPADVSQAGASFFSPDGTHLTVATSPAAGGDAEEVTAELVDLPALVSHPLAGGLIPAGWLSPTTVVTFRPEGVAGGDPGTYLLGLDGTSTRLSTSSTVVGLAA